MDATQLRMALMISGRYVVLQLDLLTADLVLGRSDVFVSAGLSFRSH